MSTHKPEQPFKKVERTILEMDLIGYSTICDNLEQSLNVEAVANLNAQIQFFVDDGLKHVGLDRKATVMATTGDGGILAFSAPDVAHEFAKAVHKATATHNAERKAVIAKRVFRMGVATGSIAIRQRSDGGFDIAGTTIARAVRLESKALPGAILIDQSTVNGLRAAVRRLYTGPKEVAGKRDELFDAYEYVVDAEAPRSASSFLDLVPKGSAVPTLFAGFVEEHGNPCPVDGSECGGNTPPELAMELWVENAPKQTDKVAFEILDASFTDSHWSISRSKSGKKRAREFLTAEMSSYGDVNIIFRGIGKGVGNWSFRTTLHEALTRYYKGTNMSLGIQRALEQIHEH